MPSRIEEFVRALDSNGVVKRPLSSRPAWPCPRPPPRVKSWSKTSPPSMLIVRFNPSSVPASSSSLVSAANQRLSTKANGHLSLAKLLGYRGHPQCGEQKLQPTQIHNGAWHDSYGKLRHCDRAVRRHSWRASKANTMATKRHATTIIHSSDPLLL